MDMNVLTITSYGDQPEDDCTITMSPMAIKMLKAKSLSEVRQGRSVRRLTIFFLDGEFEEIYVNEVDLSTIEGIVGGYGFQEESY